MNGSPGPRRRVAAALVAATAVAATIMAHDQLQASSEGAGVAEREVQAAPEPAPPTTPIPDPPADVADGANQAAQLGVNPIKFFDDYSWKMFIALNWPAKAGARGVPDAQKPFGGPGPVVWETWKEAQEVFLASGADPGDWESLQVAGIPQAAADAARRGEKVLTSFIKLEDINQAGFSPSLPLGPLVGLNKEYVRYETRFNKVQYEKIRGNPNDDATKLYLRKNIPGTGQPALNFPVTSTEVKAAWREFDLSDPAEAAALDRYYHEKALVRDPITGAFQEKTVGLVGFHIVQKTASRPEWIWSTFEHVENLSGAHPSFNDPEGPQGPPLVNVDPDTGATPKAISKTNPAQPKHQRKPIQVVRLRPIHDSTHQTNSLYREMIKDTVWKNYELVMTQWPTNPGGTGVGSPFPASGPAHPTNPQSTPNVSNSTMETYVQTSSTCMNCHGLSAPRRADFVFTLFNRAVDPSESQPLDALARRAAAALSPITADVDEKIDRNKPDFMKARAKE